MVVSAKTIVEAFWSQVRDKAERPAIMHKIKGEYTPVIWREHGLTTELAMAGLARNGITRGAHAAILSHPSPRWTWADMAILSLGGVTVPIYPTLAVPEVEFLIKHSDAQAIFVEDQVQLKKVLDGKPAEKLKFAVLMNGQAPPSTATLKIMTWEDLLKDGEIHLLTAREELAKQREEVSPDDLASIVYTSGTTGIPKGVMIHHRNIIAVCKAVGERLDFKEQDLVLSFLPLSHVYERVGGQFVSIFFGVTMAYAEAIETVPRNMVETHPTIINGVPRFYEKAYQRIQFESKKLPRPQQILINWAFSLGKEIQTKVAGSEGNGSVERREHTTNSLLKQLKAAELRAADRLVFSKIRRRFGGRLRMLVSGAAPLPGEVQRFFDTIGLTIVEGYGLTETCAPVACNTPLSNRPGTVGKPLVGVEVRIAGDGELLVKGDTVFSGYYKNDEATADAFENGWFKTGDIAEIDKDGFISIRDRKKDIIITAGGKHVAPQYIENLFKGDPLISHCLVYGDRRKFITCLFTLNMDNLKVFADKNKISYTDLEELTEHPLVISAVQQSVDRKNEGLANFEKIKRFSLLKKDFSIEANELTPTFKVKRKLVTEKYKEVLDGLYPKEDLEIQ
jgi:long-chain acyl-CoA synthetase